MCGRFVLTSDANVIQQQFDLDNMPNMMQPRYNIAPTQPIAVISNDSPKDLTYQQWGLIPSWSKDPTIGSKMINARAETVHEKPSFRSAFKRRRCLILANGFYEWTKLGGGKTKTPIFIHLNNHALFAFAGLWEVWHSPHGDEVYTCTIITTEPNELVRPLHSRMAVILEEEDRTLWLSPDELPADRLKPLLRPYPSDRMNAYAVSTLVNKPSNDVPECILPVGPPQQATLL